MTNFVHSRSPKLSDVVTLSFENESSENKEIRILTLCQGCNTLVPDINRHFESSTCKLAVNQTADSPQKTISSRVFLSLDDLANISSSPNVLEDLGNGRLNQSGTLNEFHS